LDTLDILQPGPDGPSPQVSEKAGALQTRSFGKAALRHVRFQRPKNYPGERPVKPCWLAGRVRWTGAHGQVAAGAGSGAHNSPDRRVLGRALEGTARPAGRRRLRAARLGRNLRRWQDLQADIVLTDEQLIDLLGNTP